jgi:hypothetical protein
MVEDLVGLYNIRFIICWFVMGVCRISFQKIKEGEKSVRRKSGTQNRAAKAITRKS